MNILVTGNRGFIGQNMVNALKDKHKLTTCEINEGLPSVEGLDWVIHLGALSSTTERNVEYVMKYNYDFSVSLLNECIMHNVNFQYASSASVYGLNMHFNEDAPKDPRSPYAWSKFLFDRYVQERTPIAFSDEYTGNMLIQGFRYFNVFGPHEDHKGNMASPYHKFTKQAKDTGVIKLFENSTDYARDFVPVELVVETHQKFFNVRETGIWNVGTGIATTFEDVAQQIAKKYNARIEYIPMPNEVKAHYQTYTCADISKLTKSLNEANSS